MATAIERVWSDDGLRAEMGRQGLIQAAKFSWERAAEETLQVYDALL